MPNAIRYRIFQYPKFQKSHSQTGLTRGNGLSADNTHRLTTVYCNPCETGESGEVADPAETVTTPVTDSVRKVPTNDWCRHDPLIMTPPSLAPQSWIPTESQTFLLASVFVVHHGRKQTHKTATKLCLAQTGPKIMGWFFVTPQKRFYRGDRKKCKICHRMQ